MSDWLLAKKALARHLVNKVTSGMIVGLGSGSTANELIVALGEHVKANSLSIKCVPTSEDSLNLAQEQGLEICEVYPECLVTDIAFDGADEIDPRGALIKGGGGALLREKLVARDSKRFIVMADESKLSESLGEKFYLPVEIIPFGWRDTLAKLKEYGGEPRVRKDEAKELFVTDQGNYIADCYGFSYDALDELQDRLLKTVGVVETGLFLGRADEIWLADLKGEVRSLTF